MIDYLGFQNGDILEMPVAEIWLGPATCSGRGLLGGGGMGPETSAGLGPDRPRP